MSSSNYCQVMIKNEEQAKKSEKRICERIPPFINSADICQEELVSDTVNRCCNYNFAYKRD